MERSETNSVRLPKTVHLLQFVFMSLFWQSDETGQKSLVRTSAEKHLAADGNVAAIPWQLPEIELREKNGLFIFG